MTTTIHKAGGRKWYLQLRSFLINSSKQQCYSKGPRLEPKRINLEKATNNENESLGKYVQRTNSLSPAEQQAGSTQASELTHHGTWICIFLSKLQSQIGHSLGHALHCHCFIVGEPMVLEKGQRVILLPGKKETQNSSPPLYQVKAKVHMPLFLRQGLTMYHRQT